MVLLRLIPIVYPCLCGPMCFRWSLYIAISSIEKSDGAVGLTTGAAIKKDCVGTAQCWKSVTFCMTARCNIINEKVTYEGIVYGACSSAPPM